jgi:hypothetical protein
LHDFLLFGLSGAAIPKPTIVGSRSAAYLMSGQYFRGGKIRHDPKHASEPRPSAILDPSEKRSRGAPSFFADSAYVQPPPSRRRASSGTSESIPVTPMPFISQPMYADIF